MIHIPKLLLLVWPFLFIWAVTVETIIYVPFSGAASSGWLLCEWPVIVSENCVIFDKLNMSSECSYPCLYKWLHSAVSKPCDISHCTLFEVIIYALIVTGTPEPWEKCFSCCAFNLNCFDTGIFYSVNDLERFVAAQCQFNRFFSLVSFSLDGHIM